MHPLKATEILEVWEHGLSQTPLERSLTLLAAACPESDPESIAAWPIGRRDDHLMQLREWIFGPRLANTARCPQCAERVEWESRISDFRRPGAAENTPSDDLDWSGAGYDVRFHLPTSMDVAAALQASGQDALQGLLRRCIVSARKGGRSCAVSGLPEAVLADLARRMETLDPQADIRIDLTCPQCSHRWSAQFDITGYLWAEIHHWAQQTLNAVHRLAGAYGWSERDILELSPARRQLYLEIIHS